ncbi:Hsp20/alpha crystallin family protein [Haoranjiania flava]|uniref:Hsp20/alpha crystallin family protein n=1 Tax=Haoranjiania flava TaxID=1856322 RepID=A0AAE3IL18_9BACT|nr:Hsp20/alpha crystallin family protein [Haoranjiania flava]MCU7694120.1 Hsp20/alpha crystallin family protein [Haoranjiania flava]
MTQVKTNFGTLNNLFEEIFGNTSPNWTKSEGLLPLVNIAEDDNAYYIEVVAPGLQKSDFGVKVEKGLLVVSYEKKSQEQTGKKYHKKDYALNSFRRSFNVEKTIDINRIEAKYEDGILVLTLPKMEEEKQVQTTIEIK